MTTANPFDLLGDDDTEDPSLLVAAQQQKFIAKQAQAPAQPAPTQPSQQSRPAKLPSKPLPPAEAVREMKGEGARGRGRGGGRGYGRGRGGGGFDRDLANNENPFSGNRGFSGGQAPTDGLDSGKPPERRRGYGGPRLPFRGGRRGSFSNGEADDGERPQRAFERHSGTGRGHELKREGAGQGNWGTQADEPAQGNEDVVEGEKTVGGEKPSAEEDATDSNKEKENPVNEPGEKGSEDKEMTLEEYQKVLEEKRKPLQGLKTEERKVEVDKELASMQQLSSKRSSDEIFIKLGSEKDRKREIAEKEERAKKSLSINEFLKPAKGERYYTPGGRGRGRGSRGGGGGGFNQGGGGGGFNQGGEMSYAAEAPSIEDAKQFPTLGGK